LFPKWVLFSSSIYSGKKEHFSSLAVAQNSDANFALVPGYSST